MPRALNLLRPEPAFRRECFTEGLRAAGFDVVDRLAMPAPDDAIVIWNRKSSDDAEAKRFTHVLVAENAYIRVKGWYALSLSHHGGAGAWPEGGPERWDGLGVHLHQWREGGTETVILGQRSIGELGIASPRGWEEKVRRQVGGRVRPHPGKREPGIPLERDLRNASAVVTWASSAALTALVLGIPVFYGLPHWIGAVAGRAISDFGQEPKRDDAARLAMFRRLAWAQSSVDEIRSGEAICRLIEHSRSGITQSRG